MIFVSTDSEGRQTEVTPAIAAKVSELTNGTGMCPRCGERPVLLGSEFLDGTADEEPCDQDMWCDECRM